jgi:deoxyribonuclease IV
MIFGAHISLAKGLLETIPLAKKIGATSMQFFAGNPRGWRVARYDDQEAELFKKKIKEENLGPVFLHSAYLINLGSRNKRIYSSSIDNLKIAIKKAEQIDVQGVITHLGSAAGDRDREKGIARVIKGIEQILASSKGNLILENSAGAGEVIGDQIEELAVILKKVSSSRLGICLDTAHLYGSGYDIRGRKVLNNLLKLFENEIGLDKLKVLHLNDSKGLLGSNVDRHANIGQGELGEETFSNIVNHPKLINLSGIIETPDISQDDKNLKLLKKLSNEYSKSK